MTIGVIDSVTIAQRIRYIQDTRELKSKGVLEEPAPIPRTEQEWKDTVRDMVFAYLKKTFPGCYVRPHLGTEIFALRLDTEIFMKAEKIKQWYRQSASWGTWFQNAYTSLSNIITDQSYFDLNSETVKKVVVDGENFIHVTFNMTNMGGYSQRGMTKIIELCDRIVQRETALSNHFDNIQAAIRVEEARRETVRIERARVEKAKYIQELSSRLLVPLGSYNPTGITFDDKFKKKMAEWCAENGHQPVRAHEATYKTMVPVDTVVRLMNKVGEKDADWYAVPQFGGHDVPEGFNLVTKIGKVTGHSETEERSRGGAAPIVVEKFVYLSFDMKYWEHTLPENYREILEATLRIEEESKIEFEREEAIREAERKRREEIALRVQTAKNQIREEIKRKKDLAKEAYYQSVRELDIEMEKLISEIVIEEPPSSPEIEAQASLPSFEEFLAGLKPVAKSSSADQLDEDIMDVLKKINHGRGAYYNDRAVPWEKFVAVHGPSRTIRKCFPTLEKMKDYVREQGFSALTLRDFEKGVFDYLDPTQKICEYN
jgi:hypothetical protein